MQYRTQNELRELFIQFFKEKGHHAATSFSLIPEDDPSILLIGAGMAPLKKYFTGVATPPKERMVTCQKCIRIGDIDSVGRTARHMTFFEMLGNFSFGDYFKRESLAWGLEFLIEWLGIPKEKLWASVYEEDDEAYDIWLKELNFPEERIVRLGKDDNFWEIGLGPCGPCSEIYYDRGEAFGCGDPDHKPGCDCDQFIEIWNHVFTQFNKNEDGSYTPLVNKNIDTGMGLERLATVVQEVDTVFDIDTMKSLIHEIENISGVKYGEDGEKDRFMRIIADHIRAMTFLIADGVIPSNESRGYVLRKLIRRASLHFKRLGEEESKLSSLAKKVIELYHGAYPMLDERRETILRMIDIEEDKFQLTLRKGLNFIDHILEEMGADKMLLGEQAFKLYDTFGFPLSLTQEIFEEQGKEVDLEGFEKHMRHQRETARAQVDRDHLGWQSETQKELSLLPATHFVGYETMEVKTRVLAMIKEGELVKAMLKEEEGVLVLEESSFYPTGGGQQGDQGWIHYDGGLFMVESTEKQQDLIFHYGHVEEGWITLEEDVLASVNPQTRRATARNHSATHLLHEALNKVLGESAQQAGSLVDAERLRFDFNYFQPMTQAEIKAVEQLVNEAIYEALPVGSEILSLEAARKEGAKALFSEKYGDEVRVIKMGTSMELCGGTHVANTAEIGLFKIMGERSIASGIRRIEALTGQNALQFYEKNLEQLELSARLLKADPRELPQKISALQEDANQWKRELSRLKDQINRDRMKDMIGVNIERDGVHLYLRGFKDMSVDEMKQLADMILERDANAFVLFGTLLDGRIHLISASSDNAIAKGYKSGVIISRFAKELGGGGGGRDRFASAAGRDVSSFEERMKNLADYIQGIIN